MEKEMHGNGILAVSYEEFVAMNAAFDEGMWNDKDMERNWQIVQEVVESYLRRFPDQDAPKIGDIVEFSDGYHVYRHAKIVEDLYDKSKYGVLCICENGSSHISKGAGFSTSGGAFVRRHKSKLVRNGYDYNTVWTWGCHGMGAGQGIYFTLRVNRWTIPYDESSMVRSTVRINGVGAKSMDGTKLPAVRVCNSSDMYCFQSFESVKAYKAWAEYIGYRTFPRNSCLNLASNQRLVRKYIVRDEDIPKDAKVIKTVHNGRVRDCWVTADGNDIVFHTDNRSIPERKYGTKESDEETKMFWKYSDNPLGV